MGWSTMMSERTKHNDDSEDEERKKNNEIERK